MACQDRYALSYAPAHLLEAASDLPDPGGREEVVRSISGLLTDFGFLEQKTALLDVNAVLADFRAAGEVIRPEEDAVVALRRVLDREAHNLHGWDRGGLPAFFAQQIHNRAVIEGLAYPREVATRRLRLLGKPSLMLQWQMGQVGRSLARTPLISGGIRAMAMTSDGLRAVSGSRYGSVTAWDLESGNATTLGNHRMKVRAVAITADGRRALSGSEDRSFKVWDLENRQLERVVSGNEQVFSIAITPDGRQAICGMNPDLEVWDLKNGQLLKTLTGHKDVVSAVAVSADGRCAVSAAMDHTIKVWNLEKGQLVRTLSDHGSTSYSVAVTADARLAVSGSLDLTVKVWNLESGQLVRTLTGHEPGSELYGGVNSVAVTANGRRVVSGADDCTVKVWDLSDGESWTVTRHENSVQAVAVTADGHRAASGSDDGVLKVSNLDRKENPDSRTDQVSAVTVTPDGRRAVLGSPDGILKLWNVEAGTEVKTLKERDPVAWAFTPDGRQAVSGSVDGTLKLWDLRIGAETKTLAGRQKYGLHDCGHARWPQSHLRILGRHPQDLGSRKRANQDPHQPRTRACDRASALSPSAPGVIGPRSDGRRGRGRWPPRYLRILRWNSPGMGPRKRRAEQPPRPRVPRYGGHHPGRSLGRVRLAPRDPQGLGPQQPQGGLEPHRPQPYDPGGGDHPGRSLGRVRLIPRDPQGLGPQQPQGDLEPHRPRGHDPGGGHHPGRSLGRVRLG